jgi:formylglycine-generating enzyme required for sulfatase activity
MMRKPEELADWYGPDRGFSFIREVMPVVDKFCTGCHDGSKDLERLEKEGVKIQDRIVGTGRHTGKRFSEVGIPDFSNPDIAYENLHPYVRRNGPEGDYHVLTPLEFHADTSELFQMLRKGHHNVKLDRQAWDRLITWTDLNAPYNGTWTEVKANETILARRMELRKMYANVDYNPEVQINPYEKSDEVVMPPRETGPKPGDITPPKTIPVRPGTLELDLGDGVTMRLAKVPPGEFTIGSNDETPGERPVTNVKIPRAFMMGVTEVTLEQYRQFDPGYLNGVYDMHWKDHVKRGYYMNDMQFPVVRVPWKKAMEFCQWLGEKTGWMITLPTEAQWEWACRAGTETPLNYGDLDTDFSKHANLADITVRQMAVKGVNPKPFENPDYRMDFELKDPRFDDGVLHLARVGSYQPNELGLHDMHGNAAEWTRSAFRAYPYKDDDGRNDPAPGEKRVVRGGSWHDRPYRSTSTYRLGFPDWQKVYHTGFRVIAVR